MIFVAVYQFAIICLSIVNGSCGYIVSIHTSHTGQVGSNETYIECLINIQDIFRVRQVILFAFPNGIRKTIITYYDYGDTTISPSGIYLRGRVTYNTITGLSNKTELRFNELLCEDETEYQCKLEYLKVSGGSAQENYSTKSNLTVTVPTSKPISIDFSRPNISQEKPNNYAADTKNTTSSYISTTGISNSAGSDDDCFIKINNEFIDCSDVLITCVGIVGDPEEQLTVQMIENDVVTNLTMYVDPINGVIRENCSLIRTDSFATNLTRTGHRIKFRCAPTSLLHKEGMFLETEEVEMFYPVQSTAIVNVPENAIYPPVSLYCTADGNPSPQYQWYKYEIGGTRFISSFQNITILRASDSGIYRCVVTNTFGQHETKINITLQEYIYPTTTTSKTEEVHSTTSYVSTHGNPSTDPIMAENPCNCVPAVLGGVFGTLGFCLMLTVAVFMWQKRSKKAGDDPRHQMTSIPDQSLSSHYEGISGERTDHDYTELRQRHEHPYYNTQIQSTR